MISGIAPRTDSPNSFSSNSLLLNVLLKYIIITTSTILTINPNLIAYSKELYPTVNIKVLEQVNVNSGDLMSKKIMIMSIGFIFGSIVSIGGVVMMMYFNNTFKSKESLEEELGLAVLGAIPDIIVS